MFLEKKKKRNKKKYTDEIIGSISAVPSRARVLGTRLELVQENYDL